MEKPKYLEIIKNIKRDDVTDIDKGTAIMQMLEFASLNHINKDELVEIIRYLFPFVYDWDGKECVPDTDVGEWNKCPDKTPQDGQEIIVYVKGKEFSQKGCAIYREYPEGAVIMGFGEEPIEVEEGDEVYWLPSPKAPQQTGGNNMANNVPQRVTLKQYTEEMGMEHLYWEGEGADDGYFLEYDLLNEYCEDEGIPLPKEVYGCKNKYPKLYGENLIDDLAEQLELDEVSQLNGNAQKEIMEWVEMFNERLQEEHGQHIFYPDKSLIVVLEED